MFFFLPFPSLPCITNISSHTISLDVVHVQYIVTQDQVKVIPMQDIATCNFLQDVDTSQNVLMIGAHPVGEAQPRVHFFQCRGTPVRSITLSLLLAFSISICNSSFFSLLCIIINHLWSLFRLPVGPNHLQTDFTSSITLQAEPATGEIWFHNSCC